ncbi:DUF6431 domain-containing protein [Thermoanaerobacterium thermosulfurigenes]|uniref:DUF6431 domain-containing protein n=1 Tax=Thermoanaerobacterium thermosulfurigenes TaxID=33950 RepID=UPI003EF8A57D
MIIIAFPVKNIHEYIENKSYLYIDTPSGCPNCNYNGKLYRHGYYCRGVFIDNDCVDITIARVICPVCHKTHALIPDFLVPYFIYPLSVILTSLKKIFIDGHGTTYVADEIIKEFNLSFVKEQNISYFKMRFLSIMNYVYSFFANFQEYIETMNSLSPRTLISNICKYTKEKLKFNLHYFDLMKVHFFKKV